MGKSDVGVYSTGFDAIQDTMNDGYDRGDGCSGQWPLRPSGTEEAADNNILEYSDLAEQLKSTMQYSDQGQPADGHHAQSQVMAFAPQDLDDEWLFPQDAAKGKPVEQPVKMQDVSTGLSNPDQAIMELLQGTGTGVGVSQSTPAAGRPLQVPQQMPASGEMLGGEPLSLDVCSTMQMSSEFTASSMPNTGRGQSMAVDDIGVGAPESMGGVESGDGDNPNNQKVIEDILDRLARIHTLPQEVKPDRGTDVGMDRDASGSFFINDDAAIRRGRTREATGWNSDGELRERSSSMRNSVRRSSPGPASRFCHICARTQRTARHITCANFKRGECRKSVCEKCFNTYNWDWDVASQPDSDWVCTHCRNCCPSKARCVIYEKVNNKRREKSLSKDGRRRTPSSSPARGPRGGLQPSGGSLRSPSHSYASSSYFTEPPSPIGESNSRDSFFGGNQSPTTRPRDSYSPASDM